MKPVSLIGIYKQNFNLAEYTDSVTVQALINTSNNTDMKNRVSLFSHSKTEKQGSDQSFSLTLLATFMTSVEPNILWAYN